MFGHSAWDNYRTRSDSPTFAGEETVADEESAFLKSYEHKFGQTVGDRATIHISKPLDELAENRPTSYVSWRLWNDTDKDGTTGNHQQLHDESLVHYEALKAILDDETLTNEEKITQINEYDDWLPPAEDEQQDDEGQKIIWSKPPPPSPSSDSKVGLYILGGLGLLVAGYLYFIIRNPQAYVQATAIRTGGGLISDLIT